MSGNDERFRYSLTLTDAFEKEMEDTIFKSLEDLSIHTDDPSVLLDWFESGGAWPEHVWKRFQRFLNKLHPGKFEDPNE